MTPQSKRRRLPRTSIRMLGVFVALLCGYLACWKPTIQCGGADVERVASRDVGFVVRVNVIAPLVTELAVEKADESTGLYVVDRTCYLWFFGAVVRVPGKHRHFTEMAVDETFSPLERAVRESHAKN